MDFLQVLFSFIVIGIIISGAISYVNLISKPYVDIKKYSMTTGLVLSVLLFTAYNKGVLTALEIPIDGVTNQPYFHYVDIAVSSILGAGGSQAFHKIIKSIEASLKK